MSEKQIWKYHIGVRPTPLSMPLGARVLCAGTQQDMVFIWVEVVVDEERGFDHEDRWFQVFGTGHTLSPNIRDYVGTTQTHDGMFVWHVYEVEMAK